ncbi:MAG: protein of unknown function YeeE/YedE [Deltaproteobacteria bacterium]|nr:protein of unknown function YeeE/YedE [Deltaproteobacteria bacterium]
MGPVNPKNGGRPSTVGGQQQRDQTDQKLFGAERVKAMEYFIKEAPKIDWQWMFVVGIFFGSLIAASSSRTFRWQAVPDMWRERFGASKGKRAVVAFIGGAVAMFGARLADG